MPKLAAPVTHLSILFAGATATGIFADGLGVFDVKANGTEIMMDFMLDEFLTLLDSIRACSASFTVSDLSSRGNPGLIVQPEHSDLAHLTCVQVVSGDPALGISA